MIESICQKCGRARGSNNDECPVMGAITCNRFALEDVAFLDDAARRLGTRLDIPAKLPGIDEDHIHFVLMPIGAVSRRAAVVWLEANSDGAPTGVEIRTCAECGENVAVDGFSWCDECRQRGDFDGSGGA